MLLTSNPLNSLYYTTGWRASELKTAYSYIDSAHSQPLNRHSHPFTGHRQSLNRHSHLLTVHSQPFRQLAMTSIHRRFGTIVYQSDDTIIQSKGTAVRHLAQFFIAAVVAYLRPCSPERIIMAFPDRSSKLKIYIYIYILNFLIFGSVVKILLGAEHLFLCLKC